MASNLSASEVEAALASLPLWTHDASKRALSRSFKFKNFSEAFGFMTRVALAAEAKDHHPDWSNSFNKVEISLSTHSAGGVTEKDIGLALAIDKVAGS